MLISFLFTICTLLRYIIDKLYTIIRHNSSLLFFSNVCQTNIQISLPVAYFLVMNSHQIFNYDHFKFLASTDSFLLSLFYNDASVKAFVVSYRLEYLCSTKRPMEMMVSDTLSHRLWMEQLKQFLHRRGIFRTLVEKLIVL